MLTAAEWLSENSERQELAVMNIPLAMELYAKYRETELSRPPKDVVEAIEKYIFDHHPTIGVNVFDYFKNAALHGYSLASSEAVEFAKWLQRSPFAYYDGLWHFDIETRTTAQLFDLFKKERNG